MNIHRYNNGRNRRPMHMVARALTPLMLILAACGSGGSSDSAPQSPTTTPMALVANQDDTTLSVLRLDGQGSPMISTLSLGPVQSDIIGGVTFSLGEWIFVTNTATNSAAAIDPIGGRTPILETFLRTGQRPKHIYRDPLNREVLWTMNEGDPVTGIDTVAPCPVGGSSTVLHNSHLAPGGLKPHFVVTTCLFGKGEEFVAFSRPTATDPAIPKYALISSKTTGTITFVTNDPADGQNQFRALIPIDLCDNVKEVCDSFPLTPNASAPAAMLWSQMTGKIYSYLSGYGSVVEIDPVTFAIVRKVDVTLPPPSTTVFHSVGITPDGHFLLLVGEDILSDPTKAIGKFAAVRLDTPLPTDPLVVTPFVIPALENVRPALFQFTPDGKRLYLTQSNSSVGLPFAVQTHNLKKDRLLAFDPSTLPATTAFVAEVSLSAAESHGMDLWITGPKGSGSAKGVVVTNATPGVNGTVSLIDAATNTITETIPVGKNPKHVTVYYYGLVASDNQATPKW